MRRRNCRCLVTTGHGVVVGSLGILGISLEGFDPGGIPGTYAGGLGGIAQDALDGAGLGVEFVLNGAQIALHVLVVLVVEVLKSTLTNS